MRPEIWKVGELAKETGLSVRTLHYYDEIDLLSPSRHTDAGHRLYIASDVVRLQQIKSLRQLGFSLEEIRDLLSRPDYSPQHVIRLHIARLREQIKLQQRLCKRLEVIAAHLRSEEKGSVEEFIQTIKEVNMMERFARYFTPEQRKELEERRRAVGEERIRQAEGEWKELIKLVRAEMEKGTDPASEPVRLLAKRYMGLIQEFTGGNREIAKSLRTMYQQEPAVASEYGYTHDPKISEYISKALEASKKRE